MVRRCAGWRDSLERVEAANAALHDDLEAVASLATDYIRAARTNSGNEPSLSVYHRAEDALSEALARPGVQKALHNV